MRIKTLFLIALCFGYLNVQSQSEKLLYGFADLPQTLLLNPGAETNLRYHLGVPFLSRISFSAASTDGSISEIFLKDGVNFNDKLTKLSNRLRNTDYLSISANIEVINFGYRLNDRTYLNAGFYEELDLTGYFPKDVVQLILNGNSKHINRPFDFSQIKAQADLLGVLHVGFSYKLNSKLNLGARLKLYSGGLNISSLENSGTFTTREGGGNIYQHDINSMDVQIHTSGLYKDKTDSLSITSKEVFKNSFFGANRGVGIDVGFTYHITPQTQISGSILDIGYIDFEKNIKNIIYKGNYIFDGVNIDANASEPTDYWQTLKDDFNENVKQERNFEKYSAWRPIKWNGAFSYSFGNKVTQDCFVNNYKQYYDTTVGAQMHVISKPLKDLVSLTAFYEKQFGDNIQTKVTYTMDDYSLSNFGLAVSAKFGKFQWYGMIDNIFEIAKIADSRYVSFQTGINLIIE